MDSKPPLHSQQPPGLFETYIWPILVFPLTLNIKLLSLAFRWIKPFSPQLIPLAVAFLLFPVLVFFSFSAGFYVWKNVAVAWQAPVYLQYGYVVELCSCYHDLMSTREGPIPWAEVNLPSLVVQQPYDVSLQLIVPASEANIALGNFMTALTLSTPSNRTLESVRRPVSAISYMYVVAQSI